MASSPDPPSPLLVRLPESIPWAHRKLEIYFQSRASGGGECSVQPVGPSAPDTFEVKFLKKAGEPGQGKQGKARVQRWTQQVSKSIPACFRGEPTRVWLCLWDSAVHRLPPSHTDAVRLHLRISHQTQLREETKCGGWD